MIARHEHSSEHADLWARIAAPIALSLVQWRQNGKAKTRDGKFYAPFVAYIDAQIVRERLDLCVPGEWDLTTELLPSVMASPDGEVNEEPIAFKARLRILGTIREDVGTGRDYKTAATDAFKRAAMRFGIGHELYTDYEILWVQVDGDGRYAKPVEDPAHAFARKHGSGVKSAVAENPAVPSVRERNVDAAPARQQAAPEPAAIADGSGPLPEPSCPKCGGRMWDNRLSKRSPKAPDYKCRDRSCDGLIWPAKKAHQQENLTNTPAPAQRTAEAVLADDSDEEGLPF